MKVCAELEPVHKRSGGEIAETILPSRQRVPPQRILILCLLFVVLAGLYGPRPFLLGFYCDDWYELLLVQETHGRFSWALFQEAFEWSGSRPGLIVTKWLCISLLGKSPFLWHVALTSGCVLISWLAAKLASALNSLEEKDLFACAPVMLTFLVAPWTFGFTAWPDCLASHPALILFLLSSILVVRGLANERVCWWAFPLFTLSCLIYECCYLQFLPLVALCMVCSTNRPRKSTWFRLGLVLAGFTLAQGAAVLLKAWCSNSWMGKRNFYPDFLQLATDGILGLPQILLQSASGAQTLTRYAFLALALLFVFSILGKRRSRLGTGFLGSLNVRALMLPSACVLALLSGVVVSFVIYAMASYRISGLGLESRTMIGSTLWLCLLVGLLTGNSASTETVPRAWLRHLAFCLLMVGLGLGSARRMQDWSQAWKMEKDILNAVPVEQIAATDPNAMIVALVPHQYHAVTVFENFWDLGPALGVTYPATKCGLGPIKKNGLRPERGVFTHTSFRRTFWDGNTLVQTWPNGQKIWEAPASEVWVWDYYNRRFYQASKGLAID